MTKVIEWSTPSEKDLAVYYEYLLKNGLIKNKAPLKNATCLQCTHCYVTIHSGYSGEYVSCKCGKIGVDQTEFYTRIIGNEGDYEIIQTATKDAEAS